MKLSTPPKILRRVLLAPAMVLATTLLLGALPVAAIVLAFGIRFSRNRWRPIRLFWFLLIYLLRETMGLFALLFLWIVSGFGWRLHTERFRVAHVALAGWYLRGLVDSAASVLGLELVTDSPPVLDSPEVPVLVFSRHAGAGDSFILVHLLINEYGRSPRIVLKDLLQLDPCIDVVLNRLPSRFIEPNPPPGSGVVESIRDLATGLDAGDALVLFPEGGNFSERRRTRAIAALGAAGLDESVAKALELTYVLPPRPGGAFAAIDAAPGADVIFVAHTGLERLSSLKDIWKGLPMDREVRLNWWLEKRDRIPTDHAERIAWLYEWWERIDTWIEERHDPQLPTTPKLVDETGGQGALPAAAGSTRE